MSFIRVRALPGIDSLPGSRASSPRKRRYSTGLAGKMPATPETRVFDMSFMRSQDGH